MPRSERCTFLQYNISRVSEEASAPEDTIEDWTFHLRTISPEARFPSPHKTAPKNANPKMLLLDSPKIHSLSSHSPHGLLNRSFSVNPSHHPPPSTPHLGPVIRSHVVETLLLLGAAFVIHKDHADSEWLGHAREDVTES